MATCPTCYHETEPGRRPDPKSDVCAACGEPLCPHCCAEPATQGAYRHAARYCMDSGEE